MLKALGFRLAPRVKERRRHERFAGRPLTVLFNGSKHRTADWSLGGFRIDGLETTLAPRDRVEGRIDGLGVLRPGEFLAEMVWISPDGNAGFRFLEISPAFFLAMCEHKNY